MPQKRYRLEGISAKPREGERACALEPEAVQALDALVETAQKAYQSRAERRAAPVGASRCFLTGT